MNDDVREFLSSGFNLKSHLAKYLNLSTLELEKHLLTSTDELAQLHPKSLETVDVDEFYEQDVGTFHLLELAAWHLGSADYIADTLRLQRMFAKGNVLDFGGGIGTHALAAAKLPEVKHVCFVDLNPHNRKFVECRANLLGLEQSISFHRDLKSTGNVQFDTVICLDVLEHLPEPSQQLLSFLEKMSPQGIALLNWYFFKGFKKEYPFHFDDAKMINDFFKTLQNKFLEVFHPYLITTRAYKPM